MELPPVATPAGTVNLQKPCERKASTLISLGIQGVVGGIFSEQVSEQITVISAGEFSIAFESFGTAFYLLIVCYTGFYHRGIKAKGL